MERVQPDPVVTKPQTERWGCLQWSVVVGVIVLLIALMFPWTSRMPDTAGQMKAANNTRMITMALRVFAQENGGIYPDVLFKNGASANTVFRVLFTEDILTDERVFGCPGSPFVGDGRIGQAPDFYEAVGPGENHWMLVGQQGAFAPGSIPLVLENALDTSWPPKWRRSSKSPQRGRAWRDGSIVIGFNDSTAEAIKLEETSDGLLTLPSSIFNPPGLEPLPPLKVLDVEEKKP